MLQSMGLQRVGHDWETEQYSYAYLSHKGDSRSKLHIQKFNINKLFAKNNCSNS